MNPDWASENLQVIRTLMERSAVYRRALGPIMLSSGILGIVASALPCFDFFPRTIPFPAYWMMVSIIVLGCSFFLVRRQALKAGEVFWSSPTQRVFQALLPGLSAGLITGSIFMTGHGEVPPIWTLPLIWMLFYGCALHAAGFFMPRGIKLFGALFILAAGVGFFIIAQRPAWQNEELPHYIMGISFGLGQLAYGVYLWISEQRKNAL